MNRTIKTQATQPQPEPNQGENSDGHMLDEPDIGGGRKTPAEHEIDKEIKQIPRKPGGGAAPD
ncbi:hypothetical protein LJR289_000808 [Pseudoduganella sp. LjRoot289]|uniref:hypothetical protein n=1 Tax=Pseudoduganella sp. LjRoot289 TaxID=3342314 RepID=UPI003ECE61DD